MKKVFVLTGEHPARYEEMFMNWGYEPTELMMEADLIVFTGGEDVHADLYGDPMHPTTFSSRGRDAAEQIVFEEAIALNIPMVGVCRGAQFLNVMSGGKMYQDVEGHTCGTHLAFDNDGQLHVVSSTHHQMMLPDTNKGEVILVAQDFNGAPLSTNRLTHIGDGEFGDPHETTMPDIEAVYYKDTNCLCFQPHPEYYGKDHQCQQLFFRFIDEYLKIGTRLLSSAG